MSAADPATLWQASGPGMPPRAAPSGTIKADLLVIGGGFAGLSTALHAAKRGLRVVLLEARSDRLGRVGAQRRLRRAELRQGRSRGDPRAPRSGGRRPADRFRRGQRRSGLRTDPRATPSPAMPCNRAGSSPPIRAAALARTGARARANGPALGRPVEVLDAVAVARLTGARGYLGGWIDHSGGVLEPGRLCARPRPCRRDGRRAPS